MRAQRLDRCFATWCGDGRPRSETEIRGGGWLISVDCPAGEYDVLVLSIRG